MPLDLLIALATFAFVASITPGPNNLMLLASGVNFGFARTLPHMLGVGFGFMFMILCIGFGVGQLFAAFPVLYTVLKVLSVAYMLWLAWKIANSGPIEAAETSANSKPMGFWAAAAFQWVNPKAWAMALAAVANYTMPSSYLFSVGVMALVFGAVNIPSIAAWAGFGAAMSDVLRDPVRVRIFNNAMALALVASLYPVIMFEH
jgi:threonine/homoserine/homoserine lactone efflux protein